MQLRQARDVILGGDSRQLLVNRLEHRAIEQRFGRQPRGVLRGERRGGEQHQGKRGEAHPRSLYCRPMCGFRI